MTHRIVASLLVGLVGLAAPRAASACSAEYCPGPRIWLEAGASLPANTPGVWVDLSRVVDAAPELELWLEVEGELVEQEARLEGELLVPAAGFVEGATYQVRAVRACVTQEVDFVVGPEAPLPEALGLGRVIETGRASMPIPAYDGSCYSGVDAAYADVWVEPGAELEGWHDAVIWETFVDGERYAPRGTINAGGGAYTVPSDVQYDERHSWWGPATDRVYAACGEVPEGAVSEGVGEGVHTVVLRASIPGTDVVVESNPITVELLCGAAPEPYDPRDDCPSGLIGPQGACHPAGEPLPASGGCSVSPTRPAAWALPLLALALGACLRRRR
ncbi:MAG: hypothetical protein RLP09_12735 [Sandaracinaceae bacterium]